MPTTTQETNMAPSSTPDLDAICAQIESQFHRMHQPLRARAAATAILREASAMHQRYAEHPDQPLTVDYDHDALLTRAQQLLDDLLDERATLEQAATLDQRIAEYTAATHAAKVARIEEAAAIAQERRRVELDG